MTNQTIYTLNPASMVEGTGSIGSVWRTNNTTQAETVYLTMVPGSAVAGVDYVNNTQTLTFAPGQTQAFYTVQSLEDSQVESTESFSVILTRAGSSTVLARSIVTIADNDYVEEPYPTTSWAPAAPVTPTLTPAATPAGNTVIYTNNSVTNYNYINSNNGNTNSNNNGSFNTGSYNSSYSRTFLVDNSVRARDIVSQYLPATLSNSQFKTLDNPALAKVQASTWSGEVEISGVGQAGSNGERFDISQIDFSKAAQKPQGSVVQGTNGNDEIWGKAGWDIIDAGAGDDIIRGGNGRDILTGGTGADSIHGDFGWNTFTDSRDNFVDTLYIKSDQHLVNWLYGKAGNNPNGEKADIIEGLDSKDRIVIIGVDQSQIRVGANASAHGVTGIGIYAGNSLEALYTGKDLSTSQLAGMVTAQLNP